MNTRSEAAERLLTDARSGFANATPGCGATSNGHSVKRFSEVEGNGAERFREGPGRGARLACGSGGGSCGAQPALGRAREDAGGQRRSPSGGPNEGWRRWSPGARTGRGRERRAQLCEEKIAKLKGSWRPTGRARFRRRTLQAARQEHGVRRKDGEARRRKTRQLQTKQRAKR